MARRQEGGALAMDEECLVGDRPSSSVGDVRKRWGVAAMACAAVGTYAVLRHVSDVSPRQSPGVSNSADVVALASGVIGEPFLGCDVASVKPAQELPKICGMPFHYSMDGVGKLTWGIHAYEKLFDKDGKDLAKEKAIKATGTTCSDLVLVKDSRTYLGDACIGQYQPGMYTNWPLLGRWISFEADVHEQPDGCWADVMLVHMHDNGDIGTKSKDYWCDADKSNGRKCQEITISVNKVGFRARARTDPTDTTGVSVGVGGNDNEASWEKNIYGEGKKIDTKKPFSVAVSFKVGNIMEVVLTQGKETSGVKSITVSGLDAHITHGMTPVFWSRGVKKDADMSWLGGEKKLTKDPTCKSVTISDLTNNALPR